MSNEYDPNQQDREGEDDLYVDDKTPLTEEEIEEAKTVIAKEHPLANTPLHQAFPHLYKLIWCCICCCINK